MTTGFQRIRRSNPTESKVALMISDCWLVSFRAHIKPPSNIKLLVQQCRLEVILVNKTLKIPILKELRFQRVIILIVAKIILLLTIIVTIIVKCLSFCI